jgi:uncharacterized membrane protein YccC
LETSQQPAIAAEAARQERELCEMWRKQLDAQLKSITIEIQNSERHLQDATASTERARRSLDEWKNTHQEGTLGYRAFLDQYQVAVQRAEAAEKKCELRLTQLREESASVQQKLSEIPQKPPSPPPPQPPPPPAPPEEDLLAKLMIAASRYWLYIVVGILVVIWLVFRKLTQ